MEQTTYPGRSAARLPELPEHISLHITAEGGVVLDADRQMMFAANPAATLLWCCLAEAMSREESLARLCRATGLPPADAEAMLEASLARWRADGLLGPPPAADRPRSEPEPGPEPAVDGRRPASTVAARRPHIKGVPYRLLDTDFVLFCDDPSVRAMAADPVRHLRQPATGADAIEIEVAATPGGHVLLCGGMEEARSADVREIGPLVLALMSWRAVQRSGATCAIHAGAVVDEAGELVLLPGPAGTGKSTLVAGLATCGATAACDDTVLLTGERLEARPVGVGLCLKETAWPVLCGVSPGLSQLPIHRRPDGLKARYLAHASGADTENGAGMRVGRVVFPRHDPDAGAGTLEVLDTGTALARLSPHIHFLERRLDAELVERLIGWIETVPCFALRYGTLDGALRLFAETRS